MSCVCPPTGLGNPECPKHGLKPGVKFPPMDRHSRPGEDARMAQSRLYRESMGLPPEYECIICGRLGPRAFQRVPGRLHGFRCRGRVACRRRLKKRGLSPEQRLGRVPIG